MMLMFISLFMLYLSILMLFKNTFIYMMFSLMNLFSMNMSISMIFDWMSCLFLSTILLISSMILMFSTYYIPKNEMMRFNYMLLMFILSMSILIMSNNLFLMLLGWDMLGMSSYILVIYYQNNSSAASGSITLLSNRLGDIFILLSISMLMYMCNWEFNMNENYFLIIMLMLMTAACTKSAQFPFSAWLPMAMSAPTPISALVHSSTLVTAGVFLMIRIMTYPHLITMFILMILSSMTALYASMSANWEQDLKKIIALSTLSQMAMMMFALSINSIFLAYFHLIIHAFFKSLMFMCAGIMIHESNYQDMRKMSMISKSLPLISSTLGISSMALMGIPFMSGFFSKDSIIEKMISSSTECLFSIFMILSIGMTASYSFRMIKLSNNMKIKINSNTMNHSNMNSNLPVTLMIPLSILMGSMFLWTINPINSLFFFSNYYKWYIMMILILGALIGMLMSFKNYKFKSMGQSAISLWFIHFMSCSLMNILSPIMNLFFWMDKNWQENYGPNNSYYTLLNISSKFEIIKSLQLMFMIMLFLFPLILIN